MIIGWRGCAVIDRTELNVMIALIGKGAHAFFQIAAERRRPADAQHLASCTDSVAEETLIATPIAGNQSIVDHSVQEYTVGVPAILPLGNLVRQIEVVPNPGKIDACSQRRLAQQIAAAI